MSDSEAGEEERRRYERLVRAAAALLQLMEDFDIMQEFPDVIELRESLAEVWSHP